MNRENFPDIPWRIFVQVQRAADEYERISILAAWVLGITTDAVADMPAEQVMTAFQQAMERASLDPTMRQSGESVGSP